MGTPFLAVNVADGISVVRSPMVLQCPHHATSNRSSTPDLPGAPRLHSCGFLRRRVNGCAVTVACVAIGAGEFGDRDLDRAG